MTPRLATYGDETMVTAFVNSAGKLQVVTDGPDARCPECGYPERHRVFADFTTAELVEDGCPSCETPHG